MAGIMDFKKTDKELYSASEDRPKHLEVPELPFAFIKGRGDPNGTAFAEAVGTLYGFSYALRMSERNGIGPLGYVPYVVAPLEGLWSLAIGTAYDPKDKSSLGWTIMIRQPSFLDAAGFERIRDFAKGKAEKKKESTFCFERLQFGMLAEGVCAQILHRGPYDDEPATFARMEAVLAKEGWCRLSKDHREIYLSDPRKTQPELMKTVLRVQIRKK